MMKTYYVVLFGNVRSGFETVGPFAKITDAYEYCEQFDCTWYVLPLQSPESKIAITYK
jgi:hypothetical protein